MKKIFSLILFTMLLYTQTYIEQWKEIKNLEGSNLPKSALEKVELIYKKAKAEGNENQIIKALLHKSKYISTLKEDGVINSIENIEKELEKIEKPTTKLILKSILAEMYTDYLYRHHYQTRAYIENNNKGIKSWSNKRLSNKISQLYMDSLGDEAKDVKIEEYKTILTEEENSEGLRPTLYDFLAFRALSYFNNSRSYLTKPIYDFYLKDKEAFGSVQTFIDHKFQTPNPNSFKYKTLLIYQELLRFHKSRREQKALQHINFERVSFVYNNFIGDKKEQYYIDALNSLESQQTYSEALYYLAKYYYQKGNYRKAINYANRGVESEDKYLSQRCKGIKKDIEWKSIKLNMEKVNLPNENLLAKLSYRNVNRVFIRVIKVSDKEHKKLNDIDYNKRDDYIRGLKSLNEFNLSLPATDDYKTHHTEVSLGSYGYGHYIFLVSKDKEFSKFSKNFSAVSKIAYFHKNSKLLVVNRVTGEPLEGLKAELYLSKYNNRTRKREIEFVTTETSNRDGIITLQKSKYQYEIHLKYKEDSINFATGSSYNEDRYYSQKKRETLYIFTDRAIYRPAQTVYFKGLAIQNSTKDKPKILTNKKIEVTLYSSNRQKIATKKFTTNEFGTINGSFTLPKTGRLGSMRISSNIGGSKNIRVEEYKRPKFEVSFDKLDKSYRLGDSVSVKGVAKAYAGNTIDGATVKYSIKRTISFPWLGWGCDILPYRDSTEKQISIGETKTDQNGRFEIDFDALADESISAQSKPSFSYQISVDITDTTGETQSNSKIINIGSIAVNADMIIDDTINIDSNKSLKLETTNLDGEFEPLKGKIVIEKFKELKKVYRKRYWEKDDIDKPLYTKEKFQNLFKNYTPIEKEDRVKQKIATLKFDTQKSKHLTLGKLKQGEYLLTLYTKDRYGTEVKKSKKITIYDLNASKPPYQTPLWDKTDKKVYEIGSTATIHIKSSSPNSHVLLTIEKDKKIVKSKWIKIGDLTKELVKIGKKDRGNIFYYLNMVKNSRQYSSYGTIEVPWKKKLKVEYRSFRDKLKPNQKEQWSIKISGEDKEKIVAEMVATMYDASLDRFVNHNFNIRNLFPNRFRNYENQWEAKSFSLVRGTVEWRYDGYDLEDIKRRVFYAIKRFGFYSPPNHHRDYDGSSVVDSLAVITSNSIAPVAYSEPIQADAFAEEAEGGFGGGISISNTPTSISISISKPIPIRKNLKETMFFKPNLKTDKDGNIIINFKTNEALTHWKFLGFVHTKNLKTAVTQKEITTQKELMVVTNLPRFFREGDIITLSAKVVNMSPKDLNGTCQIFLVDPTNQWNIYGEHNFTKRVSLKKGASTEVNFKIKIPQVDSVSAIKHTIIAKTKYYSDAEQIIRPILSNREFITESKSLSIKGKETKTFTLKSLQNNNSKTLKNHKLTLEFTSNPIWYAIKSLPYLMEYPHECSEQLFNRYYANTLASKIANSQPKIKKIFESWKSKGELKSALTTNQELKSILLEETPWVLESQSQEEQQQNIALLFDLHRLAKERDEVLSKLSQRQNSDGGWAWFSGGKSNWYISQYLVEGFGKLEELGVKNNSKKLLKETINFMDRKMLKHYKTLEKAVKRGYVKFEDEHLSSILIHYLYSRSFYQPQIEAKAQKAYNYYLEQAKKYWVNKGLYEQGMIALTLNRKGDKKTAKAIVKSLKERALIDDERGMYFKYNHGFYWNEMPIETHALMIDVFHTITKDEKSVELLKIWLLKNKQTTHWKTTKATASAIYALLQDNKSLDNKQLVDISFDTKIEYQPILEKAKASAQKGTGYFKATFDKFDKDMATLKVKNPNSNIAWGGLYWQYFENLDKIESFEETPLTIDKKIFLVRQTQAGEKLVAIDRVSLKVGDKIKVRLEIGVDRDMEYIMLKDSRASAFEPINVLSQYKWQDGLGYYESTKDNATYFFIDYLKRGTYVFEYPLFITHKGNFSNGIATIESMYAPEFKSHSKGERINVK